MKPTTELIQTALGNTQALSQRCQAAVLHLYAARQLFEVDAESMRARQQLLDAREYLVSLRRTQTAVLTNLAAALKSLDEVPPALTCAHVKLCAHFDEPGSEIQCRKCGTWFFCCSRCEARPDAQALMPRRVVEGAPA
jgi:hypothetical protein